MVAENNFLLTMAHIRTYLLCLVLVPSLILGSSSHGRTRRESLDRDCVMVCHYECTIWTARLDIKLCARRCMDVGAENFTDSICFDVIRHQQEKRAMANVYPWGSRGNFLSGWGMPFARASRFEPQVYKD